jgi:DNA-binding NarL/FixJ family response regulator
MEVDREVLCVLIADDQSLIRVAMASLVSNKIDQPVQISEASSYRQCLEILAQSRFDLVLCDIGMPDLGRERNLGAVVKAATPAPVLAVSGSDNVLAARSALGLGARGFVSKSDKADVLLVAIQLVLMGEFYAPARYMLAPRDHGPELEAEYRIPGQDQRRPLTERQLELLGLLARGMSNKEIARTLGISPATVKVHLKDIYKRLDVSNRAQAALEAHRLLSTAIASVPNGRNGESRPVGDHKDE